MCIKSDREYLSPAPQTHRASTCSQTTRSADVKIVALPPSLAKDQIVVLIFPFHSSITISRPQQRGHSISLEKSLPSRHCCIFFMLPTLSFVQPNHNVQDKRAMFPVIISFNISFEKEQSRLWMIS